MMKYLGIDFGLKRIGISISDDSAKMAFPYSVLSNDKRLFENLKGIIIKENISTVVVGESKDFSGKNNKIMDKINIFAEKIKKDFKINLFFEEEFLTSVQAEKIQGKNKMIDASSAAIILQTHLDKLNNSLL